MADKKVGGYDLEGARKAEISDADSLKHLSQVHNYDLAGARSAGISDEESLSHLATLTAPKAEVFEKESPELFGLIGAGAGILGAAGDVLFSKSRPLFRMGEKLFGMEDPNTKVKPRIFSTPAEVAERAIQARMPQVDGGATENYMKSGQYISPEGKPLYYGAGDTGDYSGARKAAERAIETEKMFPGMKVLQGGTPIALPQDLTTQVETQRAETQRMQDIKNQQEVNRAAEQRAQMLAERNRLKNIQQRGKILTGTGTIGTKVGAPILGGYEVGSQGAQAINRLSRDDLQLSDIASGVANLGGVGMGGAAMWPGRLRVPKAIISTGLGHLANVLDTRDPRRPKSVLEEKAAGGLAGYAKGKSVDEEKPFVGYPQIKRTNRNPNFKPQVDKYTGMFDALIGGGKRENLSVFDPKEMAYSEAYDKYEPAGIALMGAPFLGGPIKSLGKALAPKAGQAAEDLLARQGLISYAAPRAKMSPGLSFGNMAPVNAQTVTNPLRNEFPGIYKRPDVIAQEAAARVAPEDPMLKRLFGVTRDDLFEMSQRQGNVPGFIPGASKNPKGSAAAEAVMNPRNTQRLIDVLGEVKTNAPELYKGMHAWYTMDPQYHRMVELMGEEKAKQMYHRLNTFGGIESPNLPVPVEFNRASAANWLAEQGRMPDWIKYGGLRDKPLIEGIPADMIGIPGRVGHQRASESQRKFMETGEHGMISPKAPPYIQASSVPELGFQTDLPVGDAHWSRMIGLPDVRTSKEVSASVSTPELQQLAPWWKKDVAGAMDLESVPAQAIMWGAGSPQTGVKTAIGAGKLELQAIQIAEAAKRLGISPENARDLILMGKERAGKKEGGSTTPAWQRSEGKSPSGGLNALGRASYKRETGGELKAPQPEGGSRKKSFCARMGGMKKKLTSSKTANDPDSRINKALRKWKC